MDEPDLKLGRVGFCWGTIRRAELRRRSAPCVTSVFQWFQGATLAAHMFSVRDYCRWSAQAPRGSCGGLRQVQKMFKWHTGKSSGVRLPLLTHLFSLFQYTSGPQSCRLCRLGKGKRRVMDLAAQHAVLWRRQIAVGFSCSGPLRSNGRWIICTTWNLNVQNGAKRSSIQFIPLSVLAVILQFRVCFLNVL